MCLVAGLGMPGAAQAARADDHEFDEGSGVEAFELDGERAANLALLCAEYTSMAFRAGENTVIVGSTTAAADGNVSRIPLPGGLGTMISGIGVFYPDKEPTQRVGIVPDIEVLPTVAGIREGRDEVLEAALRELARLRY